MILDEVAKRVRRWLRDVSQRHYDLDTEIVPALDDAIREKYGDILKCQASYYYGQLIYTGLNDAIANYDLQVGVTSAARTTGEIYKLPADFYAVGNIRRYDQTDRPMIRFVQDAMRQDGYRQIAAYPFYDPDPNVPLVPYETWSLYDDTHFRILPPPASNKQLYQLNYFRKWKQAIAGPDQVDVPERCITFLAATVASDLMIAETSGAAQAMRGRLGEIQDNFMKGDLKPLSGVIPEVNVWW